MCGLCADTVEGLMSGTISVFPGLAYLAVSFSGAPHSLALDLCSSEIDLATEPIFYRAILLNGL